MDIKNLLNEIAEGKRTTLKLVEALDGMEGKALVVEHRELLPEEPRPPERAESPRRNHDLYDARALIDYVTRYGSADTVIYADPVRRLVYAILDEKAPVGFEVLRLIPQVHPRFAPWICQIEKGPVVLDDFVDFLRENRKAIVEAGGLNGRALLLALSQVKASTKIELHRGRGAKALNGLTIRVNIQGAEKDDLVELPEEIVLSSPIFVGQEARRVELDLILEASRDGSSIVAKVSSADLREAVIEAFESLYSDLCALREALGCTVLYGKPEHGPWTYLKEKE